MKRLRDTPATLPVSSPTLAPAHSSPSAVPLIALPPPSASLAPGAQTPGGFYTQSARLQAVHQVAQDLDAEMVTTSGGEQLIVL